MKRFVFLFAFYALPLFAQSLNEQELANETKDCKIHYLTAKTQNLWTIDVDKGYCKNGWVQGFTSVTLKDSLNRTVKTLTGFFHQGYWFNDFTGQNDPFFRTSNDDSTQNFIFKTGEDSEVKATYYLIAQATQLEGKNYSAFITCPQTPILLAAHEPVDDFKQALFQNDVLKSAQAHLLKLCPKTQQMQIFGIDSQPTPDIEKAYFQADINLTDSSITMSYRTPIDQTNIPKPTELRHEQAENLLTILAQEPTPDEIPKILEQPSTPEVPQQKIFQSATDLVLMTRILNKNISGEVIVYVDHMDKAQHAIVTQPIPLALTSQTALSPGWYKIQGAFEAQTTPTHVQVSSAKMCQKEWCSDEN